MYKGNGNRIWKLTLSVLFVFIVGACENTGQITPNEAVASNDAGNGTSQASDPNKVIGNKEPYKLSDSKGFLLIDYNAIHANLEMISKGKDPVITSSFMRLKNEADQALEAGPFSVMDKTNLPPSGDKHDYLSMIPASWPNTRTDNGEPYIAIAGKMNPEAVSNAYDKSSFDKMIYSVETLSLAYFCSHDERYAEHAALLLNNWFINESTRMNPNLNYGQILPGTLRGNNIIDVVSLTTLPDDIAMLRDSMYWTKQDDEGMKKWFSDFGEWLENSDLGKIEHYAKNNHGTWYDVVYTTLLLAADHGDSVAQYIHDNSLNRIEQQIDRDGKMPIEFTSKESFHNTLYNMDAFSRLAIIASRVGIELWHYQGTEGQSLEKSYEYMIPYLQGKAWPKADPSDQEEHIFFSAVEAAKVYKDNKLQETVSELLRNKSTDNRINLLVENN